MSFKKKLLNFWYYHKFHTLVGIVAVLALVIGINSCVNRRQYDVGVLFMTHGYSDTFYQTEELINLFDTYATDSNDDGLSNTQFIVINYGLSLQESNSANAMRSANLASGKHVLFLIDEQNYSELKNGGFLADVSALGESEYLKEDRFEIYNSGMLSEISGFKQLDDQYYLCLRTFDKKRAENDSDYVREYESAKALFTNIVNAY